MLLNKIDECEEEEGFIKAKQQISIDYKFMFSSLPKKFRSNPFTKKIKPLKLKIQSIQNIKVSPFINQSIRTQTTNQILKKYSQNVIFNNLNDQIAQPQPNVTFDASFPMSNLEVVTRVKNHHYELYMRPDTNTNTHFQWFYFRVHIIRKKKVKITIKNFIKATMLYSKGLKPFYRSKKEQDGQKFTQIKQQVKFCEDLQTQFYNLTFNFQFKYDNDQVYFCSQPPYGYEDLQNSLQKINNAKRFVMGKTVMGNKIPYLVFHEKSQCKAVGIVIARQHPGQAVGSWMMEGFLKQLNKNRFSNQIQWVVVPMVNIDGVQLGNNRTGVLGHDFNRNWNIDQGSKKQKMFPQISSILNYIRKLKRKYPKKVKMFIDLHGHSSEQNVFTYGPQFAQNTQLFYYSRLFPQRLAAKNENFKVSQSSYRINNDKKNAARSIILKQFKIPFTYTIECTFGVMNGKCVTSDQIVKVGQDIAFTANQFLDNLYVKEQHTSTVAMIEQIKQKYSQNNHEGQEYDSASQASQDNPDRKQFQKNIQELLDSKDDKILSINKINNTETSGIGSSLDKSKRKNSVQSLSYKTKQTISDQIMTSLNSFNTSKKKVSRVATQGANPQIYNQCAYFPPVNKRRSPYQKIPVVDRFNNMKQQEVPTMMNMKQIQQRLFKLRNSRIGKKILVINAYGV